MTNMEKIEKLRAAQEALLEVCNICDSDCDGEDPDCGIWEAYEVCAARIALLTGEYERTHEQTMEAWDRVFIAAKPDLENGGVVPQNGELTD